MILFITFIYPDIDVRPNYFQMLMNVAVNHAKMEAPVRIMKMAMTVTVHLATLEMTVKQVKIDTF